MSEIIYYKDIENKVYTVYTLEKGGPIVSDISIKLAKVKFENALKLAEAVKKLLNFERQPNK